MRADSHWPSMWVTGMFNLKISLNALDRGSLRVAEIELQRSQRLGRQGCCGFAGRQQNRSVCFHKVAGAAEPNFQRSWRLQRLQRMQRLYGNQAYEAFTRPLSNATKNPFTFHVMTTVVLPLPNFVFIYLEDDIITFQLLPVFVKDDATSLSEKHIPINGSIWWQFQVLSNLHLIEPRCPPVGKS